VNDHARYPLAQLGKENQLVQRGRRGVGGGADVLLPIANSPDAITVMVVGGAGKHSCWQPTFGDGTKPTRRVIARRDGTPIRRVAELSR